MTVSDYLSRARHECGRELLLDFDGFVIRFLTNSSRLQANLEDYFSHFLAGDTVQVDRTVEGLQSGSPEIEGQWQVKQPDPGKTRIKEHILHGEGYRVVRKILTGVHLFFAGDRYVCVGPLEDNPNQVVNFINNVYLDELLADSGQLFHAAGVSTAGKGLGLAGRSGKGKSTLALKLLDRGLDLVSNDRLVVDQAGPALTMRGIAKYPRINPGTVINEPKLIEMASASDLERYLALSDDALWELEEKYDAFVEDAFGSEFILSARMNMFVSLAWDRRSTAPTKLTRAEPREHPELVEAVMKMPGVMLPRANERIGAPAIEDYVALLSACDFYILSGTVDFDWAADRIREILVTS